MRGRLIVIAGTNASGKSGLGVELARKYGGEVVSADSRQVFRGLDLGSGKITPEETVERFCYRPLTIVGHEMLSLPLTQHSLGEEKRKGKTTKRVDHPIKSKVLRHHSCL